MERSEFIQGIIEAAKIEQAPLILQVSAGARKYASHIYLMKLVEAAVEDSGFCGGGNSRRAGTCSGGKAR